MNRMDLIRDFRSFLTENHKKIIEDSVNVDELLDNDDWLSDDEWDEVYQKDQVFLQIRPIVK